MTGNANHNPFDGAWLRRTQS